MDVLFERLGFFYVLLASVVALIPVPRLRALGASGAALLGLAAAADTVGTAGSPGSFVTVNESFALGGAALIALALGLWLRRRAAPPAESVPEFRFGAASALPDALLLAGLVLAAIAPHLVPFGLGAVLMLASAAGTVVRARRPAGLIPLLLGAACLGTGLGLIFVILGPGGGELRELATGPFSLAAERLLVLLLGAASLLFLGWLPGARGAPWGRSLAMLSALLLVRLALPALPQGVATWQVPAMLFLLAALARAAWLARWGDLAIAAGLMTLWSGAREAILPGGVLVTWGWLVETGTTLAGRRGVILDSRWTGLVGLPAAVAALPALIQGLRAQVLLSVLAAVAGGTGWLLEWARGRRAAGRPLY